MIFHPHSIIKTKGGFTFFGDIHAIAHPCLNENIIKDFRHSFTLRGSTLSICESDESIFSIGSAKALLRKIMPSDGDHAKKGRSKFEVDDL